MNNRSVISINRWRYNISLRHQKVLSGDKPNPKASAVELPRRSKPQSNRNSNKPHFKQTQNATRPPPPNRALRRHRTTHLRPHSHNPSPPHAQSRRAPQDLPANRRRALGRRIRLLRTPTPNIRLLGLRQQQQQTGPTADLQPENHLHSSRPAPSTAQRRLLTEPAPHDTCEVCAFRDAQSEGLGERCE